jgi:hypothetical protein
MPRLYEASLYPKYVLNCQRCYANSSRGKTCQVGTGEGYELKLFYYYSTIYLTLFSLRPSHLNSSLQRNLNKFPSDNANDQSSLSISFLVSYGIICSVSSLAMVCTSNCASFDNTCCRTHFDITSQIKFNGVAQSYGQGKDDRLLLPIPLQ